MAKMKQANEDKNKECQRLQTIINKLKMESQSKISKSRASVGSRGSIDSRQSKEMASVFENNLKFQVQSLKA